MSTQLPPLSQMLHKGASGGHQFAHIVKLLFEEEERNNRNFSVQNFDDCRGDIDGADVFVKIDGAEVYIQVKFFISPLNKNQKESIKNDFKKVKEKLSNIKKWWLITPDDLQKDDLIWFKKTFGKNASHKGELYLTSLFFRHIEIGEQVYPNHGLKKIVEKEKVSSYQRIFLICVLFVAAIIMVGTLMFNNLSSPHKEATCKPEKGNAVIITPFSINGLHDPFSNDLIGVLDSKSGTLFKVKQDTQPFNSHSIDAPKLADKLLNKFCYKNGFIVHGNKDISSVSFNCFVYVRMNESACTTFKLRTKDQDLYLRNPEIVKFRTDTQAMIVADFLIGLANYYRCNDSIAISAFQKAQSYFKKSGTLTSYAHFYIGNILLRNNKTDKAITSYKEAIKTDFANSDYAYYNLGFAKLSLKDSAGAYVAFYDAREKNSNLQIPILLIDWCGAPNSKIQLYETDRVRFGTLKLKPTVFALEPTNITKTSATLKGIVNPNGAPSAAWFDCREEYLGTKNGLLGVTAIPIEYKISDLSPGTTYEYRVSAINGFGSIDSKIIVFTTLK